MTTLSNSLKNLLRTLSFVAVKFSSSLEKCFKKIVLILKYEIDDLYNFIMIVNFINIQTSQLQVTDD